MSAEKVREDRIRFHRNYCVHYCRRNGTEMFCDAGMDLEKVQVAPVKTDSGRTLKWGPCIHGHLLEDPESHCPKWQRRSIESAEEYSDSVAAEHKRSAVAAPFIREWRKKKPIGKQEIVECPVCGGNLHLSQAASNGHIFAICETDGCIRFME